MSDWRENVRAVFDDSSWQDELLRVAHEALVLTPGWDASKYDEESLREAVRGYVGMMREAIDNPSGEMRQFFLETAIPAFIRSGQSAQSIVGATGTWLVLVSSALTAALPEEHRAAATRWFAAFAGPYVAEVCSIATRSSS